MEATTIPQSPPNGFVKDRIQLLQLHICRLSFHHKRTSADESGREIVLFPGTPGTPSYPAYIVSYTTCLCITRQLLVQPTLKTSDARP